MERRTRKPTRLGTYDYSENGVYFLTICTQDKQKSLGKIVGGGALDAPQIQLSLIGKIVEKYIRSTKNILNVKVEKYVIMPNHIHLLVRVDRENGTSRAPSPTSSQQVSRANQLVPHAISTLKRLVNRDVGYNVFQRSYHDHVVRGERDYREIWQYMDENPYKWQEDCFFVE